MSAKLLIIPNSLKISKNGIALTAFERARKYWVENPENKIFKSIEFGQICKLYSYGPPDCESHISPKQMWTRMKHTIKKDSIYMSDTGEVCKPGMEMCIGQTLCNKDLVSIYRDYLHKVSYCKSFGLFWDSILWLGKEAQVVRNLYGEKVVDLFCAEDRSFYGSVHTRQDKIYYSVLGRDKESVLRGVGILHGVFADSYKGICEYVDNFFKKN